MRAITLIFVSVSLALLAGCSRGKPGAGGTAAGPGGEIRWHTYLDMALREAARDKRLVMADFYSPDSRASKAMDDSVFSDAQVRKLLKDVVTVRLSVDSDTAAVNSYHVTEHPSVLFLRADGTEVDRVVGYSSAAAFLSRARDILAGKNTFEDLMSGEKTHERELPYRFAVAQALYHRNQREEALARLNTIPELDPRNAFGVTDKALFLAGRILNEQSRFAESIVPLSRLIKEFPQSELVDQARIYRAVDLLRTKGRSQEGVDELTGLAREKPASAAGKWAREELGLISRGKQAGSPGH